MFLAMLAVHCDKDMKDSNTSQIYLKAKPLGADTQGMVLAALIWSSGTKKILLIQI